MQKSEEEENIQQTLAKLPPSHSALVHGYSWHFDGGNTLDGDDQHVGCIDPKNKTITIAAPWNYGREFTVLHEVGHQVWDHLLDPSFKHHWVGIVNNTQNKQNQSPEELFCMAYANYYAKNKIVIHDHPEWNRFIEALPK